MRGMEDGRMSTQTTSVEEATHHNGNRVGWEQKNWGHNLVAGAFIEESKGGKERWSEKARG